MKYLPLLLNKQVMTQEQMEHALKVMYEEIIQTKKEVMYLKTELQKVQSYLREQHKLKKQLNNK